MTDIFLSYKSEDRPRAKIIADALEQHGYSVWWDRVIPPGKTFDQVIEEALDAAKCVIVLWSKESVSSDWVKNEAREGIRRHILVPVLIDNVKIPFEFKHIQAARLVDWQRMLPNPEFDLLLDSVTEIVGRLPTQKKEIKKLSINKFVVASVLGILLLGYWMIAPGLNDSSKIPDTTRSTPSTPAAVATTTYPASIITFSPDNKTFINSIGVDFVLIPAGEFDMGSPSNEVDRNTNEGPVHHVKLSSAFYMGKYEVTQKQWRDVMGTSPSYFRGDDLPVEEVSLDDIRQFIWILNEKEGTNKYRLPSEAEWEYAERAGTSTRFSFGEDVWKLGYYAWYTGNTINSNNITTHPVGQKKPNPWGLYDMHGNVMEWVSDTWHDDYNGAPSDGSSWESEGKSAHVVRGSSWDDDARDCRSAVRREYHVPSARNHALGFRLLRDL